MGTPLVFQANEALTLRTRLGRASCSQDRSASRDALRPVPIWSGIWAPARAGCPDRRFAARKKSSAYREVSGLRADIRNPTRLTRHGHRACAQHPCCKSAGPAIINVCTATTSRKALVRWIGHLAAPFDRSSGYRPFRNSLRSVPA